MPSKLMRTLRRHRKKKNKAVTGEDGTSTGVGTTSEGHTTATLNTSLVAPSDDDGNTTDASDGDMSVGSMDETIMSREEDDLPPETPDAGGYLLRKSIISNASFKFSV